MGRDKSNVQAQKPRKANKVKKLTSRREKVISGFLKKTIKSPNKYGKFRSAPWIQMLNYELCEPNQYKSTQKDIRSWLKGDCFKNLVRQIRNPRRVTSFPGASNLDVRSDVREKMMESDCDESANAVYTEGFYRESKIEIVTLIKDSCDDGESFRMGMLLDNQESEGQDQVPVQEFMMATEANQVEHEIEAMNDSEYVVTSSLYPNVVGFEQNMEDDEDLPQPTQDPFSQMEAQSEHMDHIITEGQQEKERDDWSSSIQIRVHSREADLTHPLSSAQSNGPPPTQEPVEDNTGGKQNNHISTVGQREEEVTNRSSSTQLQVYSQSEDTHLPEEPTQENGGECSGASGTVVKEAMIQVTNEMMTTIERLNAQRGSSAAAGEMIINWNPIYHALQLLKKLLGE